MYDLGDQSIYRGKGCRTVHGAFWEGKHGVHKGRLARSAAGILKVSTSLFFSVPYRASRDRSTKISSFHCHLTPICRIQALFRRRDDG